MTKKRCHFWSIFFMAVVLMILVPMPASNAATISGTVYKEDGVNPVTNATIAVNVYNGTPCGYLQLVEQQTTSNGSYLITGLSPGVYYLKAEKIMGSADYTPEWWAEEGSIWDCWGGEAITINRSEEVLSDKNFQLDLYGSISGTLYDANGNPIKEGYILDVTAFRGSSCKNTKYIGAQETLKNPPSYTITKVPPGTYYVQSSNKGNCWYVDEYHTVSGNLNNGISHSCEAARQVTVGSGMAVKNIDFQLDIGGRISGTVYRSDGITPVTDADIRVFAFEGSACDREFADGTMTSSGNYTIAGLPAGSYFLQAFRQNGANYISEWYNEPLSSYNCSEADPVRVWLAAETGHRDFQLNSGGSITGRLLDENGLPLGNLTVEYDNEETYGGWHQALSAPDDGTFTLYGLGPGHAEITIISDPGRYLAGFRRNFYLAPDEHKDIGTFTVRKGAELRSVATRNGIPLPDCELAAGAKLVMSEVETDADGEFSFILPPGEFTIYDQEDFYAVTPRTVTVTAGDIGSTINIPPFPAYDVSNGDVYTGTVTINASPPAGTGVMAMSFMNDQEFGLNTWGGVNPLSIGGFFAGAATANPYQLATPPGSIVRLMTLLFDRGPEENASGTLIESRNGLSGGGSYSFTYDNSGSTVDGSVTRNGEPVFFALVAIYRATGNDFAGFARTDHTGHYVLYNVPDGTYYLTATAEDYDCIDKTPYFFVNDNLTIPAIELGACGRCQGDFDGDSDVDGLDLATFAAAYAAGNAQADVNGDGFVNEKDLALFAADFGTTNSP